MAENTWTADRRLYLDSTGQVVEADDPARATLLVGVGGTLPLDRARALGLLDAKALAPIAENKAIVPTTENKAQAPDTSADGAQVAADDGGRDDAPPAATKPTRPPSERR